MEPPYWRLLTSERGVSPIIVADADGLCYVVYEKLSVSYFSRARRQGERFDDFIGATACHHQFQLHFREQVDVVFLAAINFRVALLTAMATHFGNSHAVDSDGLKSLFDLVQFERLDDCLDFFHMSLSSLWVGIAPALPKRPQSRRNNPRCDGNRRNTGGQEKISNEEHGSGIKAPLHFHTTSSDRTTVIRTSARAGAFSDLVHSGFCVPSRLSLRISRSCLWAKECSNAFAA